jgi:hypothetical protein
MTTKRRRSVMPRTYEILIAQELELPPDRDVVALAKHTKGRNRARRSRELVDEFGNDFINA